MNRSSQSDGYFFSVVFCAWLLQTRPSTVILGRPQKVPTVIRVGGHGLRNVFGIMTPLERARAVFG